MTAEPFVPPPYPYERIDRFKPYGDAFESGLIDLSIGTPFDPPPPAVVEALATSNAERGYPPSIGSVPLREAIARWMGRRFDLDVPIAQMAVAIGTKEFVGTLPQWMKLRRPDRDTVLYPEISYPTYEMGATLAGCRAVPVPMTPTGGIQLDAIDPADADRALLLWVNSPGNPSGILDDLGAAAAWGRDHGVPVFSDECYVEFTWDGPGRTILEHGTDGVVAVHSLSKRSNLAGARLGFYAGDADLVDYLREVRKHVGMMVPGPVQAAGVVALDDDDHVAVQRDRYHPARSPRRRVEPLVGARHHGPGRRLLPLVQVGDAWEFTERLAREAGVLVSPAAFYGAAGADYVRVAVVQPDERIAEIARRLGV
ncbi:MAG: aminotransferase class I/II-fold pyridoxal phosphate-dependent enzyme [Ilumatobacteraceae bacterium]